MIQAVLPRQDGDLSRFVLRIKFSVVEESEYWMNVLTWSDLCEMCLHRKFVNIITNPALTHFTWTFNKYLDLTQPRPIAIMMQMIAWWEVLWHILLLRSLTNTCLSAWVSPGTACSGNVVFKCCDGSNFAQWLLSASADFKCLPNFPFVWVPPLP